MGDNDFEERPNRLPWPPILYGLGVAAALLLNALWPLGLGLPWSWRAVGLGLMGLGLGLDLLAIFTLVRHRTTFRPNQGTTHLVTSGPYALSRNPIYLGNTIAFAGAALAFDIVWLLVVLPFVTYGVLRLAVEREERHLAATFDGAWETYRRKVRRWI
jgi:protein-S-isoprenylcysteine O-methyltransferase Ste14